jgi:polysaccharide export outer membrane protein
VLLLPVFLRARFFTAFGKKTMLYRSVCAAIVTASAALLLSSCADTRKLVYFNDADQSTYTGSVSTMEPAIQKNDLLSITVNSLNPDASAVFNAPNISAAGLNTTTAIGTSAPVGYLVNQDGVISFPMLGEIKVSGMTKSQLAKHLTTQLTEKKLLVDPIVNIRFLNFRVSVLGEVTRPGVYSVPNEKLSLLEALGLAGDITIYGKKENVMVIREGDNGQKTIKRIDLNSQEIFNSPYYYLRSNDVVYVEPTQNRVQREKNQFLFPIIISLISLGIIVIDRVAL